MIASPKPIAKSSSSSLVVPSRIAVPLLELARRRSLIDEANHAELKWQLEDISKMLSGLISDLENRKV